MSTSMSSSFFFLHFLIIIYNFFISYLHFSNLSSSLTFSSPHCFSNLFYSLTFSFTLPSTLISFLIFPFIFIYFCLFLFTPSYYKFVTITSILCIVFSHKKKVPSLSLNFLVDFFIFLASLL